MRLLKIISLVGVVGLTIGFIYFAFFKPVEYPWLKVTAEVSKLQYYVGEKILVEAQLVNDSKCRSVTVYYVGILLWYRVYDADGMSVVFMERFIEEKGLMLPIGRPAIILGHDLEAGGSYPEEFIFTLEQPGRYKVVVWAELSFDKEFNYPLRIYADPIWIEVVTGSN